MMSCLTLKSPPCPHLCFMCESAHRLRDLLSTLQICKRVVHDILKKVLAICETVFTFCCGQCPNCRTVVSFGGFILASAPGFLGPSALSKACFTCVLQLFVHFGFSFFMMLCSICEPLLCDIDPSWWSRHLDFQVYIIKLQPRFCHAHVLQRISHF